MHADARFRASHRGDRRCTRRPVVKATFYQTERATDRERMRAAWTRMFGSTPPATTLLFVSGLARPEYKFEIDIVAARPVPRTP